MSEDFYKNYDYMARKPYFIEKNELTEHEWWLLTKSERFCMLPWVHMHAFPDGRAYPCCLGDDRHPIGNFKKDTMESVWNQDAYKTMRKNMLAEQSCKECTKCYEQEDHGLFSMRNSANKNFGNSIFLLLSMDSIRLSADFSANLSSGSRSPFFNSKMSAALVIRPSFINCSTIFEKCGNL